MQSCSMLVLNFIHRSPKKTPKKNAEILFMQNENYMLSRNNECATIFFRFFVRWSVAKLQLSTEPLEFRNKRKLDMTYSVATICVSIYGEKKKTREREESEK